VGILCLNDEPVLSLSVFSHTRYIKGFGCWSFFFLVLVDGKEREGDRGRHGKSRTLGVLFRFVLGGDLLGGMGMRRGGGGCIYLEKKNGK
jgi:hypothetical protein